MHRRRKKMGEIKSILLAQAKQREGKRWLVHLDVWMVDTFHDEHFVTMNFGLLAHSTLMHVCIYTIAKGHMDWKLQLKNGCRRRLHCHRCCCCCYVQCTLFSVSLPIISDINLLLVSFTYLSLLPHPLVTFVCFTLCAMKRLQVPRCLMCNAQYMYMRCDIVHIQLCVRTLLTMHSVSVSIAFDCFYFGAVFSSIDTDKI